LTFDGAQNVVVKVGDATLTAGTDYEIYTSDTATKPTSPHTFEVAFKKIKNYTIGTTITVTYSATVNSNAAIGTPGNKNETDVTYSNNPNNSSNGNPGENPKPGSDTPTGTSAKDTTVTYVAELDLTKYKDAIGEGNLLSGATFTLTGTSNIVKGKGADIFVQDDVNGTYWKLKDNTYTTTAPHGDIMDADNNVTVVSNEASYDSTTKKYKLQHVTEYESGTEEIFMQGTSGNDGKIVFKGLGAGTYTLTEVVTPTGYNTADPITFTIVIDVPETITDGTEAADFSVTGVTEGATVTLKNANATTGKASTGIYETNIVDKSGTTLPSTGGIGTTIFYVMGSILVICASVVLVTRRRMAA
jgi:LPXTG-motif cell wall-anchored protein